LDLTARPVATDKKHRASEIYTIVHQRGVVTYMRTVQPHDYPNRVTKSGGATRSATQTSSVRLLGRAARTAIKLALIVALLVATVTSILAVVGGIAFYEANRSATIRGFPAVRQEHSLSCEYAAASAVTHYWGRLVSENDFIAAIPSNSNPHLGYRGNIDGTWGGTRDYGIYAEPLVPVLEEHGYKAGVFYNGEQRLKDELDDGHPVVVWIAGRPGPLPRSFFDAGAQSFSLTPYEHALVVTGYDRQRVIVMDVGSGAFRSFDWNDFRERWSYFDQMALVITPHN
jgi:uncharacterized protein YvpB